MSWFHLLFGLGARALLNPDVTASYHVIPDIDVNQGVATQMYDGAARTKDVVNRNVKRAFIQDSGGRKDGKEKDHIRKAMSFDSEMDTIMSSEDPEAALAEALENALEEHDETIMNQLYEDEVDAGLITELTAKVDNLGTQTATELLESCNWVLADAEVLHNQINELLAIGALAVDFGSIMDDFGHSGYNDTSQVTTDKLRKIYSVMKVLEEMVQLKSRRKFIAKAALQRAMWDTASAEAHINNVKTLVDAIVAKRDKHGGEYDMLVFILQNVATEEVVGYDIDVAYKDYIAQRRRKSLTEISRKEGYTSAWLGPKDNIWGTKKCTAVGTFDISRTLDQCKSECENEALCNTISFKQDGGYCFKQSCPEPVEEPETEEPGYVGYALIGFKEAAENCRCAGSYEKEKSYLRKLGEYEINIGGCAQQCASIPNCAAFVVWTGKQKRCEIRTGACPPREKPELCEQKIDMAKGQSSKAYNKLITVYRRTDKQQYCSTATELKDHAQCWTAARDLRLSFGGAFYGTGNHRYCFQVEDESGKVYFNTAENDAAASPPNPSYASICHVL